MCLYGEFYISIFRGMIVAQFLLSKSVKNIYRFNTIDAYHIS